MIKQTNKFRIKTKSSKINILDILDSMDSFHSDPSFLKNLIEIEGIKKTLDPTFLELLAQFDFFLIDSNVSHSSIYFHKQLNIPVFSGAQKYYMLQPLILLTSLKRFIRLFQFFVVQKQKLIFQFSETYYEDLFEVLTKKANIQLKNMLINKPNMRDPERAYGSYLCFNTNHNSIFYKKAFKNFNCIILEFSSFLKNKDFGSYKIFADFSDWKKYVFILLLIKHIVNKTKFNDIYEKNTKI